MTFAGIVYRLIQQFGYPKLRRVCVAAITFDRTAPLDLSKWDMCPFADGTHYVGEQVTDYLRTFEVVILQHWMPAEGIAYLRSLGLKVLLWFEIEAVQGRSWAGAIDEQKEQRQTVLRHLLLGADGAPINVYEKLPSKTPALAVDMLSPALLPDLASLFESVTHLGASGAFLDSMVALSYWGTATNAPDRQDRSQVWPLIVPMARVLGTVWGNTVQASAPRQWGLDVMFAEHFFYYNSEIDQAVQAAHAGLCVCPARSDWTQSSTRWKYLSHGLALRGVSDLWVTTAWTGQFHIEPCWYWGT